MLIPGSRRARLCARRPALLAVVCATALAGAPAVGNATDGATGRQGGTAGRAPTTQPFARVTALCAGDDGRITMRAQRTPRGGTSVTSRLRELDHERWFGGMYVDYDAEQPTERFRAVRGGFDDALRSTTSWGTEAIAYYDANGEASCVVDVAATPSRVAGGADYIGLIARPRAHTLRLHFAGYYPERAYDLRVELLTSTGDAVTLRRRVRTDDSGFLDHTLSGLRRLEKFTRLAFHATSVGRSPDHLWTVVVRGRS